MRIVVDGLVTNYRKQGKGKPILMLHGWGSDLRTFDEISNHFTKKYQVIRLDLPGFGGSELPPPNWALENYAHFVKDFIDKLSVAKLYGLIGHSLGARVAIKCVSSKLVKPTRLVLIGAHGIKESKTARNRAFWVLAKLGKAVAVVLPHSYKLALRRQLYQRAGSVDYLEAGELKPAFSNIIREDLQTAATKISTRTLLIYGEGDTTTPPKFGIRFQALIKKSQLKIVKSAAHYAHLNQPTEVANLILAFLK